jgi:hypothetical protein
MKIVFAGSFAARLADPVRARLAIPCEMVVDQEARILPGLADADVLVSMAFTRQMAEAGHRLRLIQVPGAGLDRIDLSALRPQMRLANAHGHEAGIAEYVIGAMIALTRSFRGIDSKLRQGQWESQWAVGAPAPPQIRSKALDRDADISETAKGDYRTAGSWWRIKARSSDIWDGWASVAPQLADQSAESRRVSD